MDWYVIQVWRNEEKYVARVISPFVDEVKKFTKMNLVKRGKGMKCESVSMLPGYILIKVDMTQEIFSTICNLPYVIHLITDSNFNPIKIEEEAIHQFERKLYEENLEQCTLSDLNEDLLTRNSTANSKNNSFYM